PEQVVAELTQPVRPLRLVLVTLVDRTAELVAYVSNAGAPPMCGPKHVRAPTPAEIAAHVFDVRRHAALDQERSVAVVAGDSDRVPHEVVRDAFGVALHRRK